MIYCPGILTAMVMVGQSGQQSDWTLWKAVYYLWPKLSGAERFAFSFIGDEGLREFGSIYPLINVLFYVLILSTLLFWRFRNEDIV